MPALTAAAVTAAAPSMPVIVLGPVAVRVNAVSSAVPPLSLTTVLSNVSVAGWSSLVTVQVAFWLWLSAMLEPVWVPPTQTQAPAV